MRLRSIRNIPRIKDITTTLFRHGLHGLAEALGLPMVDRLWRLAGKEDADWQRVARSIPARVRCVLQELGPTFVKLGQILSTRPDLLPQELIDELTKLQDSVPPMPFETVAEVVRQELGADVDAVFESFERTPLAAASIGQVHRARTRSGRDVVVKVQRVGIVDVVAADMDILFSLAAIMAEENVLGEIYDPVAIVEEFRRSLGRELDYTRELRNICTFRANFADNDKVKIPEVFPELCTPRVLVMEFIRGVKVSEADPVEHDCPALARHGVDAVLQQVFTDGCFHADPHPGNLFIVGRDVVCFVDFGMIGRLSVTQRDGLSNLLAALADRDYDLLAREIVRVAQPQGEVNLDELSVAFLETLDPFYGATLGQVDVGQMIRDCLDVAARFRIRFPSSLSLMLKSLITVESMGRLLDPNFDMLGAVRPFVQRLILSRLGPQRIKRDASLALRDVWGLLERAPWRLDGLMSRLQRGDLTVQVAHQRLEAVVQGLDEGSNRVALSLLIASLVVGSSLVMGRPGTPEVLGVGLASLMWWGAGLLGIWLAVSILRSGRI